MAFYGPKTGPLRGFLRQCLDGVAEAIVRHGAGCAFHAYSLEQIHATVVGLERRTRSGFENRNLHALRGASRGMELMGFFRFLCESDRLPFRARFGGFANVDHPFESRGATPYERSFSVQGEIAVVIGWPIRAGRGGSAPSPTDAPAHPMVLDDLRREAQKFNLLHRWHRRPSDIDNDLYLRLGLVARELPPSRRALVETEMRQRLSASSPVIVPVGIADLAVVSYPADDEALPDDRTRAVSLGDARLQDEGFIAGLYD